MSENSRKTPGVGFNQTSYRYIIGIGVTMGAAEFNHALVRLDDETTELVSDDLEDCSYKGLKEQHIMRLLVNGGPLTNKLNHLLTKLTQGDRAPSQLLREMKQWWGDKVSIELLQDLWL